MDITEHSAQEDTKMKANRYDELDRATRMVVDHMINALASSPSTARDAALRAGLAIAEYNDAVAADLADA